MKPQVLHSNGNQQLAFPLAFGALVMGAVAMGISPAFVRQAEIGPFASAFWRVALALPVLAVWAWMDMQRARQAVGSQPIIAFSRPIVLSGLFFAGDLTFWHLAIMNTTMANATLMACLAPVWVVLLSGVFIGERVGANSFIGLGVCLAGASLLMGSSFQLAPERLVGDLYGIVTSLFFGLYFLAMRVGRRVHGSGQLIFGSTLVTAMALLVIAVLSGDGFLPETAQGYAALLSLGVISHAGGQGLLAVALGSLSAVFSSLVIFIEAVAAAFVGWLFFNETLGPLQWVGGTLILAGIWVARPREKAADPQPRFDEVN